MPTITLKETRQANAEPASIGRMLAFFVPLGLSATLVTVSHVIINSTLARAANPEMVIASYALAMSLLGITEKPAILLRQTCSALVRDRISFRAMTAIAWLVFLSIFLMGSIVAYSSLGRWIFLSFFGVAENQLQAVLGVYRILMFVSIFSGIRCLYHGLIIFNKRTLWLTIGMVIRLVAMYGLAQYYIATGQVNSGRVGAIIFLTGMVIESMVSVLEGRSLLKHIIPEKLAGHPVERKRHVFSFYRPLLYSSFIAVIVGPSINAILGKTANMELSIASFAIAVSLTQLVQSFFSYIHQIVLNFYQTDRRQVIRFAFMVAFIPGFLLGLLGYTPLGPWFLKSVMGVGNELMTASLHTLRIFMLLTFLYPWVDFANGVVMLKGQTKIMVWSQASNVTVTLITLFLLISSLPRWNGMIGALAQSLGTAGELAVVLYVLRKSSGESRSLPAP